MNVFNLISAGGGKSEGLYIWKKSLKEWVITSEMMEDNTMVDSTASTKRTIYYSNEITRSGDIVTLVNPQSIQMSHSSQSALPYNVYLEKDTYYMVDNPSGTFFFVSPQIYEYGTQNTKGSFFINSSNYILYIKGNWLGATRTIVNKSHYKLVNTFVGYVVSDKESAYPDKAEQDGFYYERITPLTLEPEDLNASVIVHGYFTPTANVSNYKITHNAGKGLQFAFVSSNTDTQGAILRTYQRIVGGYVGEGQIAYGTDSANSISTSAVSVTTTETVLYSSSSPIFSAGTTYEYILF